jgi:flagellar motor protein MotB
MAGRTRRRENAPEKEDTYFVSMTDLMVGLLFIFIIMLMFFALQYKEVTERREEVIENVTNAEMARNSILEDLQERLEKQGIRVQIAREQGVLRLPEDILFDKAKADLSLQGREAIKKVADALDIVLPCYAKTQRDLRTTCPGRRAYIEAIFVEGHTDSDPLQPRPGMQDNLDLSAIRATNTFRALMEHRPGLLGYQNLGDNPVMSVSGYGEHRPVEPDQSDESHKRMNRRIDLRILMNIPRREKDFDFLEGEIGRRMEDR